VNKGRLLGLFMIAATVALVAIGTIWPVPSAAAYAGGSSLIRSSSTPEETVRTLGDDMRLHAWEKAYSSLANKAQFTEPQFVQDLTGRYASLRTYATLESFDVAPLRSSSIDADVQMKLHWSSVVGAFVDTRNVHVVKNGSHWEAEWPIVKEPTVPPQVIPVNYLRWDVINRGSADDWGAQDVEAPHVRIIDMHPVERADGVVILGELLNEDVVPAYVSVSATLQSKAGAAIETEGSFDKISHILLPKQVTPFFINFPNRRLSEVGSVKMTPLSTLVPASADPIILIQDEKLNPAPDASVTGQLVNQSGQVVNVAHVMATFYDQGGQVVWVSDQYVDRALLPGTPVPFNIRVPQDLGRKVSTERTVTSTYSAGGAQ
jgi:hypothetical protein